MKSYLFQLPRPNGDFNATFPKGQPDELIVFGYSPDHPQIFIDRPVAPMSGRKNPLTPAQKLAMHKEADAQRALLPSHKEYCRVSYDKAAKIYFIADHISGLMVEVTKLPGGWGVQKGKFVMA